jgi:hypothetical protein
MEDDASQLGRWASVRAAPMHRCEHNRRAQLQRTSLPQTLHDGGWHFEPIRRNPQLRAAARSGGWAQATDTCTSILEPEALSATWLPLVRYWVRPTDFK